MTEETKETELPEEGQTEEAREETVETEEPVEPEETEVSHETEYPLPDYAEMAKKDLEEIKSLRPEFTGVEHLGALPFAERFAELRDLGLSVEEALGAVCPRREAPDLKAHLHSVFPRTGARGNSVMSHSELMEARDLFGDLSDREIADLYRRVNK